MAKCDCGFEAKNEHGLAIHRGVKHKKDNKNKYSKWLSQIALILPYIALALLAASVILLALDAAEPISIKDIPKGMRISAGFAGIENYSINGDLNLYNTWYGLPDSDYFVAGNRVFARDINILVSDANMMTMANLKLYAFPEELSDKRCPTLTQEEKNTFGGVPLLGILKGKRQYISPKKQTLPMEYTGSGELFKEGSWKVLLCLETFHTSVPNVEEPKISQIGMKTIHVITNYDLALLEYQRKAGVQSYAGLAIVAITLVVIIGLEGMRMGTKSKEKD